MLSAVDDRQALIVPSVVTKTNFAEPALGAIAAAAPLVQLLAGPATANSIGWPAKSLAAL
jgi:hypothetical protein